MAKPHCSLTPSLFVQTPEIKKPIVKSWNDENYIRIHQLRPTCDHCGRLMSQSTPPRTQRAGAVRYQCKKSGCSQPNSVYKRLDTGVFCDASGVPFDRSDLPEPIAMQEETRESSVALDGPDDLRSDSDRRCEALARIDDTQSLDLMGKVKSILWAQWNDAEWLTIRQLADFLGVEESTVKNNLKHFRSEFEGEVFRLASDSLRDFKSALRLSDSLSAVIPASTPQLNVFSPRGALRMCFISQSEVAKEVRTAALNLIGAIPQMVEQAVEASKAAPMVATRDTADLVLSEQVTWAIEKQTTILERVATNTAPPVANVPYTHEFSGLAVPCDRINSVVIEHGLPAMFLPDGTPNWRVWDGKTPVRCNKPVIYVVFSDLEMVGRLRDVFSIGEGDEGTARVSSNHERIKLLCQNGYACKVLYTVIQNARSKSRQARRKDLEAPLQSALQTTWEELWDEDDRAAFRENQNLFG